MNAIREKTTTDNLSLHDFWKKGKTSLNLELKDIVSAQITKKTDQKVIVRMFGDKDFEFESSEISGDEGDFIKFEVVENDSNGTVLKQLKGKEDLNKELQKQKSFKDAKSIFTENKVNDEESSALGKLNKIIKEKIEEKKVLGKLKRNLMYVRNSANRNIVNELVSNGLSLEKIDLSTLKMVIKETKTAKMNVNRKYDKNSNIGNFLEEQGINVSERNIDSIKSVINKTNEIKSISESTVLNVLKSGNLTLENIYISKFSSKENTNNISDEDFENLKPQIKNFFESENIPETEENFSIARNFISEEISLSKDNFDKYNFLSNIDKNLDLNLILIEASKNIKNEIGVSDIDLFSLNKTGKIFENYKEIIDVFKNLDEKDLENISLQNNQMPLSELIKQNDYILENKNTDLEKIQLTKSQLAEIQIKLTYEAAYRLAGKNIDISTMPLENGLSNLKELEKDNYIKNLKIMNVEPTNENKEKIWDVFNKVSNLKGIRHVTYKEILENKINFNIEKVSESIIRNYESQATEVKTSLGDNFSKIREDIPKFLENINISSNEKNIKAFEILSKNNIEVTEDNINKILVIEEKLSSITNKLHPNIAAKMIGEGLNPLEMHVDEILEYVNKFEEVFGNDFKDKIAENIFKLEQDKNISDETKKSVMAIYRALNQIQKNNSVSIGTLYNSGNDLTMENLLNASKYFSKTKLKSEAVDVKVNKDFGELKEIVKQGLSIREMIENGIEKSSDGQNEFFKAELEKIGLPVTLENIETFKAFKDSNESDVKKYFDKVFINKNNVEYLNNEMSPDYLKETIEEPNFKNKTVSEIKDEIKKLSQNSFADDIVKVRKIYNNIIEDKILNKIEPESLLWLQENNIPLTIKNINFTNMILNNPEIVSEELNNIFDEDEISLFDDNKLDEELLTKLDDKLDSNINLFEKINDTKDLIRLQEFISNSNNSNIFTKRAKVSNKLTDLNMYIIDENLENKESVSIYMSFDSEKLGGLSFNINKKGEKVSLEINAEDENSLLEMEKNKNYLLSFLNEAGFELEEINFNTKEFTNYFKKEIFEDKFL